MQRRAERSVAERHTEENPRALLSATGHRPRLAFLVRGSSRRITTMRPRSANIRVINRRHSLLGDRPLGSACHRLRRRQEQARCARRCATLDSILAGARIATKGGLTPSIVQKEEGEQPFGRS
jgi:hypothetical protein